MNSPDEAVPVKQVGTTSISGDVAVTNTPSVNVTNTPSVNVANSPTVSALQSGPWHVGIDGAVAVSGGVQAQQDGQWTVGIDVAANTVRLDPAVTVPVKVMDTRAEQPFQIRLSAAGSNGEGFVVPAGARAVIESVSVSTQAHLLQDGEFLIPFVETTVGGELVRHAVALQVQEYTLNGDVFRLYLASEQTRLYADAGTTVRVTSACGQCVSLQFTLSGLLVASS